MPSSAIHRSVMPAGTNAMQGNIGDNTDNDAKDNRRSTIIADLTSGREFYDDGYTEEEQNAPDLPSTFATGAALSAAVGGADVRHQSTNVNMNVGIDPNIATAMDTNVNMHAHVHTHTQTYTQTSSHNRSFSANAGSTRTSTAQNGEASNSPTAVIEEASSPLPKSQHLFGRERELHRLTQIHKTLIKQPGHRELNRAEEQRIGSATEAAATNPASIYPAVLVWGTSGTGKSRLVRHFLDVSCCTCGARHPQDPDSADDDHAQRGQHFQRGRPCSCCYVLCGKYDEYTGKTDPFSAIIQALNDFSEQLRIGPPQELERIRMSIWDAFGGGAQNNVDGRKQSGSTHSSQSGGDATSEHEIIDQDRSGEPSINAHLHSVMSGLITVVPSLSILAPQLTAHSSGSSVLAGGESVRSDDTFDKKNAARRTRRAHSDNENDAHRNFVMRSASSGSLSVSTSGQRRGAEPTKLRLMHDSQSTWNRLQYIFIQFMKAISTPQRPVYLFLDDLQWSPSTSLELLASLIADPDLSSFMLLATIREETNPHNDEIVDFPSDSPLKASFLSRLADSNQGDRDSHHRTSALPDDEPERAQATTTITPASASATSDSASTEHASFKRLEHLTVGNMSQQDTVDWLSELLERDEDDSELRLLARKLHEKTHGNVLFMLQGIEELKRKNILVFSRISFQWEWNLMSLRKKGGNSDSDRKSNTHASMGGGDDGYDDLELPISDNIIATIESQLKQLPPDLQRLLSIAAYIRGNFDTLVLSHVLESEGSEADGIWNANSNPVAHGMDGTATSPTWTEAKVRTVLEQAAAEKLVNINVGKGQHRFAHDRIQQAAYGLIPYGETRDKLRVRIGHSLLQLYRRTCELHYDDDNDDDDSLGSGNSEENDSHDEVSISLNADTDAPGTPQDGQAAHPAATNNNNNNLLFVAADHLNSVQTKDHIFSGTLNLEVGERALQMASLASAAAYLQKASNELKRVRNPWEDHYDTTLRLFRARSEVELSLGHTEIGHKLGWELIERARSIDEKLPTYLSMAKALAQKDDMKASLSISLHVVRMFGAFPKRFYGVYITKSMMRINSFLKAHSDEEIINLPLLDDSRTAILMQFITDIGLRSYMKGDFVQWIVHVCQGVMLMIDRGICEDSVLGLANFGIVWSTITNDHQMALRCADMALAIRDRIDGRKIAGWAYVSTCGVAYPYSRSLKTIEQMYQKGYNLAMQTGEFETGMWNLLLRDITEFCAGRNLQELVRRFEHSLQQDKIYSVGTTTGFSTAIFHMLQRLAGKRPIDWDAVEKLSHRDVRKDPPEQARVLEVSFQIYAGARFALYFRKYQLADRLLKQYLVLSKPEKSYMRMVCRGLLSGLTASAMFRSTRKRKYKRILKRRKLSYQRMADTKGENVRFHALILEAEEESLASARPSAARIRHVREAYDRAIRCAAKTPLVQYAALGCELAAEFFIRMQSRVGDQKHDEDGGAAVVSADIIKSYLVEAVEWYKKWGCALKVDDIEKRHSGYLQNW